jgi:hypothetical protein
MITTILVESEKWGEVTNRDSVTEPKRRKRGINFAKNVLSLFQRKFCSVCGDRKKRTFVLLIVVKASWMKMPVFLLHARNSGKEQCSEQGLCSNTP